MKYYEVIAQLAKANSPSFYSEGYETYLLEAKDYFNVKSRIATNPKSIIKIEIVDSETIRIILISKEELNLSQVSRSLRVFSMYLIDESHSLNFSKLISGKRLFRMQASEVEPKTKADVIIANSEKKDNINIATQAIFEETNNIDNMVVDEAMIMQKLTNLLILARNDRNYKIIIKKISNIIDYYMIKQEGK